MGTGGGVGDFFSTRGEMGGGFSSGGGGNVCGGWLTFVLGGMKGFGAGAGASVNAFALSRTLGGVGWGELPWEAAE